MGHVQDNAEESVRRVIDVLKDGEFAYPLDDGSVVRVGIAIDRTTRGATVDRSEEHTSELQSLMRISYAVFCLKKKNSEEHTTRAYTQTKLLDANIRSHKTNTETI